MDGETSQLDSIRLQCRLVCPGGSSDSKPLRKSVDNIRIEPHSRKIMTLVNVFNLILVLVALIPDLGHAKDNRESKYFSFFQVVRFPNDYCNTSSTNDLGNCFTAEECKQKGGVSIGECASGFGVCCKISGSCDLTVRSNVTYFQSDGFSQGQCQAKVCPDSSNICQLRLDFINFVIEQPSTSSVTTAGKLGPNGEVLDYDSNVQNSVGFSLATQCITDQFSVTSPGHSAPPVICGINSGQHMYVDVSPGTGCTDLTFFLGQSGNIKRSWNILVQQYTCDYNNLAPQGCTKYFFDGDGGGENMIKTFNYDNQHLANQRERFCVRREKNTCRICWSAVDPLDFSVSDGGSPPQVTDIRKNSECCGYSGGTGYDCLVIPGASKESKSPLSFDEFCGNSGLVTSKGKNGVVCSTLTPFMITFYSDNYEVASEGVNEDPSLPNKGVLLSYELQGC